MTIRFQDDIVIPRGGALSNTLRSRVVAFGPIAVALIGIGVLAAVGDRGDKATMIGERQTIDTIITGTVAGE